MKKQTIKISPLYSKQLAFWESLFDTEPKAYLNSGDKVQLVTDQIYYGGDHGDKEYYKVNHNTFGVGYMLKEAFE